MRAATCCTPVDGCASARPPATPTARRGRPRRSRGRSPTREVATVDAFGNVTAHGTGPVTVTAMVEGGEGFGRADRGGLPGHLPPAHRRRGRPPPPATWWSSLPACWTRRATRCRARRSPGRWHTCPNDSIVAPAGPGQVDDGRFVAAWPGLYTVVATTGNLSARESVRVSRRGAVQELEIVGQGANRASSPPTCGSGRGSTGATTPSRVRRWATGSASCGTSPTPPTLSRPDPSRSTRAPPTT